MPGQTDTTAATQTTDLISDQSDSTVEEEIEKYEIDSESPSVDTLEAVQTRLDRLVDFLNESMELVQEIVEEDVELRYQKNCLDQKNLDLENAIRKSGEQIAILQSDKLTLKTQLEKDQIKFVASEQEKQRLNKEIENLEKAIEKLKSEIKNEKNIRWSTINHIEDSIKGLKKFDPSQDIYIKTTETPKTYEAVFCTGKSNTGKTLLKKLTGAFPHIHWKSYRVRIVNLPQADLYCFYTPSLTHAQTDYVETVIPSNQIVHIHNNEQARTMIQDWLDKQ